MDIRKNWKLIQKIFEKSHASSFHYALATINEDGSPHITPIGALFLRDNLTGFFFDQFPNSRNSITITQQKNDAIVRRIK